jgi:hypothetical protein
MNLPKLTNKQQEILQLLYKHRFLNRIQIQTLLHHKSHKTITVWLQDLREKHYVEWIYSTDFTEKSKPAIYYLGINGVRYLRTSGGYPATELRKRYYDSGRSEGFISHAKVLADICIELEQKCSENVRYVCQTAADYALTTSEFHFLTNKDSVHPDLCYTKQEAGTEKTYLVELLDATLPRYRVKRRLKVYVDYLDYNFDKWKKLSGKVERPTVLFICPSVGELLFCKRRVRKQLLKIPESKHMHIKFETLDTVQAIGFLNLKWEEA